MSLIPYFFCVMLPINICLPHLHFCPIQSVDQPLISLSFSDRHHQSRTLNTRLSCTHKVWSQPQAEIDVQAYSTTHLTTPYAVLQLFCSTSCHVTGRRGRFQPQLLNSIPTHLSNLKRLGSEEVQDKNLFNSADWRSSIFVKRYFFSICLTLISGLFRQHNFQKNSFGGKFGERRKHSCVDRSFLLKSFMDENMIK